MPRRKRPRKHQSKTDNTPFQLELIDMAHGGRAIGRHKGKLIFVPYAIPGEIIQTRVIKDRGKIAFGEGLQLIDSSADRVFPQCPHFGPGRCWGCQWQHIDYPAQLLIKQDVLADQLSRQGKFSDPILEAAMQPVIPSPEQWGYNHQMTFSRLPNGGLGLPRVDGRQLIAIDDCPVLHPELRSLYETLDLDFETVSQITFMRGSDGETMLILAVQEEDAPELTADFPTSVNIVLPDNEPVNLIGNTTVTYHVGGRDFRVTAGSEFRANVAQMDNLIPAVLQALDLHGHESVLDLYAGVGVFSAFIASRAKLVTLVESYPPAATDADENLNDLDNVDIVEGSVEDVLESMLDDEASYDAAIVDPPASGLSKDALNNLTALKPSRIVYVSSEPSTLARDGQQLTRHGYQLTRVQPLDFAPQTYYINAVACFERTR